MLRGPIEHDNCSVLELANMHHGAEIAGFERKDGRGTYPYNLFNTIEFDSMSSQQGEKKRWHDKVSENGITRGCWQLRGSGKPE